MSRKTIGYVIAILGAILAVFQKQFGLSIDPTAAAAGIGAVLTYIFFESKLDMKALAAQPGKWKDPKFWITLISVVLAAIESSFGLGIPVESVVTALTMIVGVLFRVKFKQTTPY